MKPQDQTNQGSAASGSNTDDTELDEANKKIAALTESAKRALADLQNYRKRVEEEKTSFSQFATLGIILQLLPILDNFNRAFAQVPDEIKNTEWFKGTVQIEQQLVGIMKRQGVAEMPTAVGQTLDPNIHEAVATGPGKKDIVIAEYEKGYLLGEKVIRPAKVQVGDGSEAKA